MQNAIPLLTLTVAATGAITAQRFVTPAAAQAGAGVNSLGVARYGAAIADKIPVDVMGTAYVEAGAAIDAGALVEADASGRAITRSAGAILGRVAPGDSAAAAGAFVEIVLIPN
jgi:hypothetical protein